MKSIAIIVFVFIILNVNAQVSPYVLKADSLVYNPDSSHVVVYKKKKVGLFSFEDKVFKIQLAKQKMLPYFDRGLVLFYKDDKLNVYDYKNSNTKSAADFIELENGFQIQCLEEATFLIHDFIPESWTTVSYDQEPTALSSQKSGVYNFDQSTWLIENQYEEILLLNDQFVGVQKDSKQTIVSTDDNEYALTNIQISAHIDVFTTSNKEWTLKNTELKTNAAVLEAVYGANNILNSSENLHTIELNDSVGLLKFNLFNYNDLGFRSSICDWILRPQYKMVFPNYNQSYLGTLSYENELKIFNQKGEIDSKVVMTNCKKSIYAELVYDEVVSYYIDDQKISIDENIEGNEFGFFGLELINDSMVKVLDYKYFEAYPAHTEFGYDSVDAELNMVYMSEDPIQKSGVFNLNSNQWVVEPRFINLFQARNEGWFVSYPSKVSDSWIGYEEKYFYTSPYDNPFDEDLTIDRLWANKNWVRMLVLDSNLIELTPYLSNEANPLMYSAKVGNKIKLIYFEPWSALHPFVQTQTCDFQQRNAHLDYSLYLNNDQWRIESNDTSYSINSFDSWQLHITNPQDLTCRQIILKSKNTEKNDTLVLQKGAKNKDCDSDGGLSVISVDRKADLMVVNDVNRSKTYLVDAWGEYYEEAFVDIEQSAIWQLTEKGWVRISPVYAEITSVKNGYIARTGLDPGTLVIQGEGWALFDDFGNVLVEGAKEERFIYLDEKAQPVSFMDYFDFVQISDLGFGLQFNTDKGAFFVTYMGKAITNDEWDSFELVDGKLKAIKIEQPMYNDWGEIEIDAEGNEIYLSKGKITYFDL